MPWRSLHILSLPVEILCYILNYLEVHELVGCIRVTKHLQKIISTSSQLQYKIELAKYRMVSVLPQSSKISHLIRLKLIKEREHAWRTLSWKGRYNLKLPPTGSVYEFVGGLYGNGREDEDRHVTGSISFLELPSCQNPPGNDLPELETWTHPMLDITIIDFTMDPAQDLLVLVAHAPTESKYVYELHLRSLETNEPHPRAPIATLPCLPKPTNHIMSDHIAAVRVQVSGPMVALLIKEINENQAAHLEIWDWLNNPVHSCKMSRSAGIDDFTFLSQEAFLLVRPSGTFEVYTFENPITPLTSPECHATYAFPTLAPGYMYWYITMSSNPSPGVTPLPTNDLGGRPGQQMYYPKQDQRIHACCLYIFNPTIEDRNNRVHCFVFFVNLHTLLNPPVSWFRRQALMPRPMYPRYAPRRPIISIIENTETPQVVEPVILPPVEEDEPDNWSTRPENGSEASSPPPTSGALGEIINFPVAPSTSSKHAPDAAQPSTPVSPTNAQSSQNNTSSGTSNRAPATSVPSGQTRHPSAWKASPMQGPIHIPWSVWGPGSTRWFPENLATDWQHSIYGLRTAESVTPEKLFGTGRSALFAPYSTPSTGHTPEILQNGQSSASFVFAPDAPIQTDADHAATEPPPLSNSPELLVNLLPQLLGQTADNNNDETDKPVPLRYLRIRDFNPYAVAEQKLYEECQALTGESKGKNRMSWREPRVVTEESTTPVRGVFTHDIKSSLPYVEVVSEEMFEVTDVMMDDCRLLLLKRGENGKLRRVDVLTM